MLSMNEIFILSSLDSYVKTLQTIREANKQKVSESAALTVIHKNDVETIKGDYLPYIRVQ